MMLPMISVVIYQQRDEIMESAKDISQTIAAGALQYSMRWSEPIPPPQSLEEQWDIPVWNSNGVRK